MNRPTADIEMAACAGRARRDQDQVEKYASLVKRIACHLMARLPPSVQIDDLIQSGTIGLLEALNNYDPTQGASFETYASIRIRGAMLDEIRRGDWTPRSLHRKLRTINKAASDLEARDVRAASSAAIAEEAGMSLDEYHVTLRNASSARVVSLSELMAGEEGAAVHSVQKGPEPLEVVYDGLFKQAIAEAIDDLPEREQLVMSLYYKEELNLREIGEILGVSESRVCQLHGKALLALRTQLSEWADAS